MSKTVAKYSSRAALDLTAPWSHHHHTRRCHMAEDIMIWHRGVRHLHLRFEPDALFEDSVIVSGNRQDRVLIEELMITSKRTWKGFFIKKMVLVLYYSKQKNSITVISKNGALFLRFRTRQELGIRKIWREIRRMRARQCYFPVTLLHLDGWCQV